MINCILIWCKTYSKHWLVLEKKKLQLGKGNFVFHVPLDVCRLNLASLSTGPLTIFVAPIPGCTANLFGWWVSWKPLNGMVGNQKPKTRMLEVPKKKCRRILQDPWLRFGSSFWKKNLSIVGFIGLAAFSLKNLKHVSGSCAKNMRIWQRQTYGSLTQKKKKCTNACAFSSSTSTLYNPWSLAWFT